VRATWRRGWVWGRKRDAGLGAHVVGARNWGAVEG
jgi:hypothetical protein